jgi:hypothetical protein
MQTFSPDTNIAPVRALAPQARSLYAICYASAVSNMLLRFLVYWGLAINAANHRWFFVAALCFLVPLAEGIVSFASKLGIPPPAGGGGALGMFMALVAGILFVIGGFYAQAALAIGVVVFNVALNEILAKRGW